MQVNFNPSVNQVRPQFKASFANNKQTKKALEYFLISKEEEILATQLMLEAIKTDDKIGLRYDRKIGGYCAKNMTNGKEIILRDYSYSYGGDPFIILYRAITNGTLLDIEEVEWETDPDEEAAKLIKKQVSKKQVAVDKLKRQIKSLKTQLAKSEEKLISAEYDLSQGRFAIAKKELFSRIKKIKL